MDAEYEDTVIVRWNSRCPDAARPARHCGRMAPAERSYRRVGASSAHRSIWMHEPPSLRRKSCCAIEHGRSATLRAFRDRQSVQPRLVTKLFASTETSAQ